MGYGPVFLRRNNRLWELEAIDGPQSGSNHIVLSSGGGGEIGDGTIMLWEGASRRRKTQEEGMKPEDSDIGSELNRNPFLLHQGLQHCGGENLLR